MSRLWTVALADDDSTSRGRLRALIEGETDLSVVAEADDGPSTLESLDRLHPDLALLEFHLPHLDGLDVLRSLRPRDWPTVVFFDDRTDDLDPRLSASPLAVSARPETDDGWRRLLREATAMLSNPDEHRRDRIAEVLEQVRSDGPLECLPIRHNGRIEILSLEDVDWISAAGNYVELHCAGRRLLHRIPLTALEQRLDTQQFLRIHRSTIVNTRRIRSMTPTPQGDFKLLLHNGEQLRLSRRFREAIEQLTARPQLVARA